MHLVEQAAIGLIAGLGYGLFGFFAKREHQADGGYEDFEWRKLFRTMVIFGAAGLVVGYSGEPITQGRVEMMTATTVIVGELFDKAYPRMRGLALHHLRRHGVIRRHGGT